jgi:valyl-tRNA synthetase
MESRIDHKKIQDKWQAHWTSTNEFDSALPDIVENSDSEIRTYTILLAPPNVTGKLHIGHFLNGTINDVMARRKRQEGYKVCFRAGLDHAGLATQMKVEKYLRDEKDLTKEILGKEKFLEECHIWKEQYGGIIINQFKAIGLSCDWNRVTFTLDANYYARVMSTFVELYNAGLIYKGMYLTNWCTVLETAISDEECVATEETINVYYIKYLLDQNLSDTENSNPVYLTVATTRPETLFGDTAVAYNPEDLRYTEYKGCYVFIPILNKRIPLVEDLRIKIEFGTGLCKITPAHDKDDYLTGQKYDLPIVTIFDKKGHIANTGTRYDGMYKTKAQKEVVTELRDLGLLEKIEQKKSMVQRCSRSGAVIEPMVTKQWFIRMKPLAEMATSLLDSGEVEFVPAKIENMFRGWVANIRDWCISRQIWYGHQIPVWYCENDHINCTCPATCPTICSTCGSTNLVQETDCLDTWCSSYIWQFATFTEEEMKRYYPIDLIVSAPDILFFWIMRMMMMSKFLHNKPPFKKVLFHGVIRDDKNVKISKSAGNGIDPLDIMEKHGLDPMRFGILMKAPKEDDLKLSSDTIKIGERFCTKLWNCSRFLQSINVSLFDNYTFTLETQEDNNIVDKLKDLEKKVDMCYERLDTHELTSILYTFTWDDFANGYLEYAKTDLTENRKEILSFVHDKILTLLYPIIPHIASEIREILYKNNKIDEP